MSATAQLSHDGTELVVIGHFPKRHRVHTAGVHIRNTGPESSMATRVLLNETYDQPQHVEHRDVPVRLVPHDTVVFEYRTRGRRYQNDEHEQFIVSVRPRYTGDTIVRHEPDHSRRLPAWRRFISRLFGR